MLNDIKDVKHWSHCAFRAFGWVRKAEDKKAVDVSLGWTGSIEREEAQISWPFMSELSEGTAFSGTQWGIVWMQEQEGRRGPAPFTHHQAENSSLYSHNPFQEKLQDNYGNSSALSRVKAKAREAREFLFHLTFTLACCTCTHNLADARCRLMKNTAITDATGGGLKDISW